MSDEPKLKFEAALKEFPEECEAISVLKTSSAPCSKRYANNSNWRKKMSPRLRNAQIRLKAELDRLAIRDLCKKFLSNPPKIQPELEQMVVEHGRFKIALYAWLEQEQEENYLGLPRKVKL